MTHSSQGHHPAVVLRTHHVHVRTLLALALIALVALASAVVILATRDSGAAAIRTAAPATAITPAEDAAAAAGGIDRSTYVGPGATTRYDGGPEEGTRGPGH
jgi:hypothetical protein